MTEVVLETLALTKHYGDLTAVDSLSLQVVQGEILAILGPNGAGKTTSIRLICGLLRPDAGKVLFHGLPWSADDRRRVGVCPQNAVLWERLTCLEQLVFLGEMYGLTSAAARRRSLDLLAEFDLLEKRQVLAARLSGGMRRRLNIAMAVVHDPELVVLDEPEAGLDPQSRIKMRDFVRGLSRSKSVILTTHNMDEADRMADRVAILDHGRLLRMETPAVLKLAAGPGQIIELRLFDDGISPATILAGIGADRRMLSIDLQSSMLRIRSTDPLAVLPQVQASLAALGARWGEVRIRENSLEDVFIQLTGRGLRQ